MKARFLILSLLAMACNAQSKTPDIASPSGSTPAAKPPAVLAAQPSATAICPPGVASTVASAPTARPRVALKHTRKTAKKASISASTPQTVAAEHISPLDRYQQALAALQQGRIAETQAHLRAQLQLTPAHQAARKLLVNLMLDTDKRSEAEILLAEGLRINPAQPDLAMLLARLQADRGARGAAQATLKKSAGYAQKNGAYLAFMGALEQQAGQHEDALIHLDAALKLAPANGPWLLAQGVSRQALGQTDRARESILLAQQSGQLDTEQQKLAKQVLARLR